MSGVRALRIGAVSAVTLVLLSLGGVTARGEDVGLFGYTLTATGSAISTLYNQPTFGVPSDPTFELRKFYSLAELDSGPSAHGLGSLVWPGQVVGNAPPSLAFDTLVFNPTQLDAVEETCFPDGLSPVTEQLPDDFPRCFGLNPEKQQLVEATEGRSGYPVRAEGFYPSDQTEASQDVAGGFSMSASTREDGSDAMSKSGGAGLAGVVTFDSAYSRSTTGVAKGLAVAKTVTHISDIDLFGAIHIDSLTATQTATSDGAKGEISSSLDIAGMLIKDQDGKPAADIFLDKTGFHVRQYGEDGKPEDKFTADPLGTLTKSVFESQLKERGINLFVGQPITTIDGASADSSMTGLVVHLDATGMGMLLESIDENDPGLNIKQTLQNPTSNHTISDPIFGESGVLSPTVAGLIGSFFQGDQDMNFVFGSTLVSSAASPPLPEFPLPEIPPFIPPAVTPPFTGGGNFGGGTGTPATNPGTVGVPLQAVGSVAIPFEIVAAIILAGLIGSSRMRLFADRLFAARVATRCSLEEVER